MPFLKDNNERTDSGHSNLGNENQPSRKIDNQFFLKKHQTDAMYKSFHNKMEN